MNDEQLEYRLLIYAFESAFEKCIEEELPPEFAKKFALEQSLFTYLTKLSDEKKNILIDEMLERNPIFREQIGAIESKAISNRVQLIRAAKEADKRKRIETDQKKREIKSKTRDLSAFFEGESETESDPFQVWYDSVRKKGEPNKMSKEELLDQWRKRRQECVKIRKDWDKAKEQFQELWKYKSENKELKRREMLYGVETLKGMESRIRELEWENSDLRSILYTLKNVQHDWDSLNAMLESSEGMPAEMLKRIRMLCHPDKHQNSEMSLKVSQYLNKRMEESV